MISNSSTDPTTCDAYYDLPEVVNENEEVSADDSDQGEYVLEKKTATVPVEVEISTPEQTKPGHRPTLEGVYDNLYDDGESHEISIDNPDKDNLKDNKGCSKQRKIFIASIIGVVVLGAISAGIALSLQGE